MKRDKDSMVRDKEGAHLAARAQRDTSTLWTGQHFLQRAPTQLARSPLSATVAGQG